MLSFRDLLAVNFQQVRHPRTRSLGVILPVTLGTAGFLAVNILGREVRRDLDRNRGVFIPIPTAQDRILAFLPPHRVSVRGQSVEAVKPVSTAISNAIVRPANHRRGEVGGIEPCARVAGAETLAPGGFGSWTILMSIVAAPSRNMEGASAA